MAQYMGRPTEKSTTRMDRTPAARSTASEEGAIAPGCALGVPEGDQGCTRGALAGGRGLRGWLLLQ